MTKKKTARGGASATKSDQLRKQLRKTEVELAKTEAKRDKARARVEALAIIADEIRAQLAESEKAAAEAKAGTGSSKRTTSKHSTPARASTRATSA